MCLKIDWSVSFFVIVLLLLDIDVLVIVGLVGLIDVIVGKYVVIVKVVIIIFNCFIFFFYSEIKVLLLFIVVNFSVNVVFG